MLINCNKINSKSNIKSIFSFYFLFCGRRSSLLEFFLFCFFLAEWNMSFSNCFIKLSVTKLTFYFASFLGFFEIILKQILNKIYFLFLSDFNTFRLFYHCSKSFRLCFPFIFLCLFLVFLSRLLD